MVNLGRRVSSPMSSLNINAEKKCQMGDIGYKEQQRRNPLATKKA